MQGRQEKYYSREDYLKLFKPREVKLDLEGLQSLKIEDMRLDKPLLEDTHPEDTINTLIDYRLIEIKKNYEKIKSFLKLGGTILKLAEENKKFYLIRSKEAADKALMLELGDQFYRDFHLFSSKEWNNYVKFHKLASSVIKKQIEISNTIPPSESKVEVVANKDYQNQLTEVMLAVRLYSVHLPDVILVVENVRDTLSALSQYFVDKDKKYSDELQKISAKIKVLCSRCQLATGEVVEETPIQVREKMEKYVEDQLANSVEEGAAQSYRF